MRKPSKIVPAPVSRSCIVIVSLAALLGQAACRDRSAANGPATDSSGSILAMTGGARGELAQRSASVPMNESAMADQAMPAAAPAPSAPFAAKTTARDAVANAAATRGDVQLGVPIPGLDVTGAMLVRHGQASIEVRGGIDAAMLKMRQAAAQHGGFIANTALRGGKEEQRSATLELRVPSDKFDGLLAAMSDLGKVESVTASAEDVAEEYVDLGARAANARKVEARLVEMLATRTGKLSDVLTVEQELARVRMEAERYDARIRWLERRASLSSLDVTIHEPLALLEPQRGPGPLAEALAEAWSRMVGVVAWCIAALGVLVPLGVLIVVGVVVVRRVWRSPPRNGPSGEVRA